jgi:hypothetical protein
MRRRYRYNPATKEMEQINLDPRAGNRGVLVCADITPFKSVVDGTVISGRRALREHNKRNDVTFTEDFKGDWERKAKERARMYGGDATFDRTRRIEHVKAAIDKHSTRRR